MGEKEFKVEYARTFAERRDGLSGRSRLYKDEGMLFIFDRPGVYGFWMKEMKFDIDIVWIRDNKVIQVDQASYKNPLKTISPKEPVDKVLEVSVNSGIKVGDVISE